MGKRETERGRENQYIYAEGNVFFSHAWFVYITHSVTDLPLSHSALVLFRRLLPWSNSTKIGKQEAKQFTYLRSI